LIHVDDGSDTDTVVTLTRGVRVAEALSLLAWQSELSDAERAELTALLPPGQSAESVVHALFDRRECMRFGRDDVQLVEDVLCDASAALDPLVVQFSRAESARSRRVYEALVDRNAHVAVRDALSRRDPASLSESERATLDSATWAVDEDAVAPPPDTTEPPVLPFGAPLVLEAPLVSERVLALVQGAIDYSALPESPPFEWTEDQVRADIARKQRSLVELADEAAAAVIVPLAPRSAAPRRRDHALLQDKADADFVGAPADNVGSAAVDEGDDASKKRSKLARAPYADTLIFPTLPFIRDLFFADVASPLSTADIVTHVGSSEEIMRLKPGALSLAAYAQLALQMMAEVAVPGSDDAKKRRSGKRRGDDDDDAAGDDAGGGVDVGGDDALKAGASGAFVEARGDGVWVWIGGVPPVDDAKAMGALNYRLQVLGQLFAFVASRRAQADMVPNSEMHISRLAAISALTEGRVVRNAFTLAHLSADAVAVIQQQEYLRYATAPAPFAYANDQQFTQSAPLSPPEGAKARHHALLRDDRPPNVTLQSVVADALARMPGGVASRADLVVQVVASPFFDRGNRSDVELVPMLSGALERLRTAADPMVRFAPEQSLWIYLWRARPILPNTVTASNATPEQWAAARALQERMSTIAASAAPPPPPVE
jgi:hypothetical protein